MYKKQMTLQRIICLLSIGVAALVFLYSLGLMTDVYDSLYLASSYKEGHRNYVAGASLYFDMQPFNRDLTKAGIILILSAVSLFVFKTHDRRKYYIANYITVGVNVLANIGVSAWALTNVFKYKAAFLAIDFEKLDKIAKIYRIEYTTSTFWFDVSLAVFIPVLLVALLSIGNLVFKIYLMREERRLVGANADSDMLSVSRIDIPASDASVADGRVKVINATSNSDAIKKDRMRFTKNSLSSSFCYLAILFNVFYFVGVYSSDIGNYYYNMHIGFSVVYNLLFLLFAFLCSEGVKKYSKGYSIFILLIGVMQAVRVFDIPMKAFVALVSDRYAMDEKQFVLSVIYLLLSANFCILAGLVGISKHNTLEKYKKETGLN